MFITPFPGPGEEQQPQFCKPLTAAGWSIISIFQARISTIYVSKKKKITQENESMFWSWLFFTHTSLNWSLQFYVGFFCNFFFFLRNTRRSVVPWAGKRNSDYILSCWDSEFGTLGQTQGLFDLRFSASWGRSHHLGLKKKKKVPCFASVEMAAHLKEPEV